MDCTKTPLELQETILRSILLSVGVKDREKDVHMLKEGEINFMSPAQHHQIASVGQKIVTAARQHVQEQLQVAMHAAKATLPSDVTPEQAKALLSKNDAVQFWLQARFRISGELVEPNKWQYILIDSPDPNAFVTEILPFRFFITTSMMKIATTADELAVVLGHEISHLVMGHNSESNYLESILRTMEVLLLSIDPTSGALTLVVIGSLAAIRSALSAAQSRENEYEADDLGLKLAARACFDTQAGAKVMQKMNQAHVSPEPTDWQQNGSLIFRRLYDSHPPSLERFEKMQANSLIENSSKHSHCVNVQSMLLNALWRGAGQQN